jgi:hypothetical protein
MSVWSAVTRSDEFPLNLWWWRCNRIGFNNATVLTEQMEEVEHTIDGKFDFQYRFKTMPGAQYGFFTGVGRTAIHEAIQRVDQLSFISGDIHHPQSEPPRVKSDAPPPPCPPWLLFGRMPFTYSEVAADSLLVSQDGWVRATYTQPDGTTRSTVFHF